MTITLERQIEQMLALHKGWDDREALPIKRETIDKALKYMPLMEEYVHNMLNIKLGQPSLTAGTDGSVDLHWNSDEYELIMNVPERALPATYYGDDKHRSKVLKGNFPKYQ